MRRTETETHLQRLERFLVLLQQARVFAPSGRRRIVLATNVAETSLTIPGIGVVIDSGLVRGMVYRAGRGYLSLLPIAFAEEAEGEAGRFADRGMLVKEECLDAVGEQIGTIDEDMEAWVGSPSEREWWRTVVSVRSIRHEWSRTGGLRRTAPSGGRLS